MDGLPRFAPWLAAAVVLAGALFGVCVILARSPLGPAAPYAGSEAASGMQRMEDSPPSSTRPKETSMDVLGVLAAEPGLGRMAALVRFCGLRPALEQTTAVTVFAPSDEAFERMRAPAYVQLLERENVPLLVSLVRRHLVPGSVSPAVLVRTGGLTALDAVLLRARAESDQILVDGARITERVKAANGWVYRVDAVLPPAPP